MSKILKRFLLILIILIGAIIILPKSEKAGLYGDYFANTVDSSFDTPAGIFFDNTDNEKWYCLEQDIHYFGVLNKNIVIRFEYDANKQQYKITYAVNDNGEQELSPESDAHKTLQKIAYIAIQDKGEVFYSQDAPEEVVRKWQTPYKNVAQLALWETLKEMGPNRDSMTDPILKYFGSKNNTHIEIIGNSIQGTGSEIATFTSTDAYTIYSNVKKEFLIDNKFSNSNGLPKTILMAIYTNDAYQNLICVDLGQKEPPEFEFELEKDKIYPIIDGYAWVDQQTGDKNAQAGDGVYKSGDLKAKGVNVTVEATIQTLEPKYKFCNIYYIDGQYVVYYECNSATETKSGVSPDESFEYESTYTKSTTTRNVSKKVTTSDNGYYSVKDIALNNYIVNLDKLDGADVTYNTGKHGPYYEYITKVKVTFEYNGAEYEVTYDYDKEQAKYTPYNNSGNGKLTIENGLKNNSYETIKSRSNLETIKLNKDTKNIEIPYKYNGTNAKTSSLDIANGNSTNSYRNVACKDSYFAKTATTNDIATNFGISSSTQDIKNICLALSPRTLDLALYMNVDHTDIAINGKIATYKENTIDIDTNKAIKEWIENNANINVDVYPTDYYYRIADYTSDNGKTLKNDNALDYSKIDSDELDIKVTYKVTMLKQAITHGSSQIKELLYYYDSDKYTLTSIKDESGKEYTAKEADNQYNNINGYKAIVVNGTWNLDKDNPTLYFTFTVNKDENNHIKTGKVKDNIVAITSYWTKLGLLDSDSSTKNIVTTNNANENSVQWEDDTSKAQSITVRITGEKRTISGNVFNDLNKGGTLDNGEAINDVVVQLIEITKNNNEYIWQETVAGSNIVKSLVRKDNEFTGIYEYRNSLTTDNKGQYEFVNIVPGNYIVRFIYGDGYNYDITVNNTTYNGADYKSTKDTYYNSEWYNNTNYFGTSASVARDNEARRLEVMATTTEIDAGLGTALDVYANNKNSITQMERANILNYLNKLKDSNDNEFNAAINYLKTLKNNNDSWNTWRNNVLSNISDGDLLVVVKKLIAYKTFMAAETSKINMPVDTNNLKTINDTNVIQYNKVNIDFANVNFGITLRPKVKLELEKHITALKITPNGNGEKPIIDAKANIVDILNGKFSVTGETKGLLTIKSTRSERGKWDIQTDTEELEQGANLEVEYTYVVENTGDEDYISSELSDLYKNSNPSDYSAGLKQIVAELKPIIKGKTHTYGSALGVYYYTGTKANTDVAVTSRAESLGEAINNQLRYEKEISGSDFTKVNTDKVSKTIYDTNGVGKTEETETIVETVKPSTSLERGLADASKKLKLTKVLASLNTDDNGNIPSYIAEVLKYSSASGTRNLESVPGNLSYVHSQDNDMTLDNSYIYEVNGQTYTVQDRNSVPQGATNIRKANENDEFWGETIMIGKGTGENKILPAQIGIAVAASVAVIGVGIVLIKRIVLAKK